MPQPLQRIQQTYDSVAKAYAEAFTDEHARKPQDREVLQRFARQVGATSPVWDLGCGPGQTTKYLHDLGLSISGLDLSGQAIVQARRLYPDIPFRQGDMLNLDFEDNSVAAAVAFYAIVHFTLDQVATFIRQVYRVLQPGGLFLFTYHVGDETLHIDEFLGQQVDIDFMYFETEDIRHLLDETGFTKVEVIEREPYPEVEYQSRRAYVFASKQESSH